MLMVQGAVARDVAAARDEAISVLLLCSVSPEIRESWTKPSTRPLTKGNPVYAYLITKPVHLVCTLSSQREITDVFISISNNVHDSHFNKTGRPVNSMPRSLK